MEQKQAIAIIRPRRLFDLMAASSYKFSFRAKRPPDPAKWPAGAVDAEGNRDWLKCSVAFLVLKLRKEVSELLAELTDLPFQPLGAQPSLVPLELIERIRLEAADVSAVCMMLADRVGCYSGLPKMPKIVCLCGSTKFKDEFMEANYRETMTGNIVLSVGFFMHAEGNMHGGQVGCTPEQKVGLDALHKRKIDLADEILVLNVGGCVDESTRSEIEYAQVTGKPVRWLEAADW